MSAQLVAVHLGDEAAPRITAAERVWLRANLTWMLAWRPDPDPLRSRLRNVSAQLQHELGRLALAVAGADGRVARPEVDAVQRLCTVLGLNSKAMHRNLHGLAAQRETTGPVTVQLPPSAEFAIPRHPMPGGLPAQRAASGWNAIASQPS